MKHAANRALVAALSDLLEGKGNLGEFDIWTVGAAIFVDDSHGDGCAAMVMAALMAPLQARDVGGAVRTSPCTLATHEARLPEGRAVGSPHGDRATLWDLSCHAVRHLGPLRVMGLLHDTYLYTINASTTTTTVFAQAQPRNSST